MLPWESDDAFRLAHCGTGRRKEGRGGILRDSSGNFGLDVGFRIEFRGQEVEADGRNQRVRGTPGQCRFL